MKHGLNTDVVQPACGLCFNVWLANQDRLMTAIQTVVDEATSPDCSARWGLGTSSATNLIP